MPASLSTGMTFPVGNIVAPGTFSPGINPSSARCPLTVTCFYTWRTVCAGDAGRGAVIVNVTESASYGVAGSYPVTTGHPGTSARVILGPSTIDPASCTVSLIVGYTDPDDGLNYTRADAAMTTVRKRRISSATRAGAGTPSRARYAL